MNYRVIWHDCEDGRTGTSFEVPGCNPKEAYSNAIEYIKSLSPFLKENFCGIDIECLEDKNGNFLNPDFFLDDKAVKAYEKFCVERKVKNKFEFNPSMGTYHPPSELVTILKEPTYLSEKIPVDEGVKEFLEVGHFFDSCPVEWHKTHYDIYNGTLAVAKGDRQGSSSAWPHLIERSLTTVKKMIDDCLSHDANITHVIREDEKRNKHFRRTELKSDVYQFWPEAGKPQ
jgi:hypothetical protein